MSEFETIYGEEFFIIDSNNLKNVQSKLYGYFVDFNNNEVVTRENLKDTNVLSSTGAYVYVERKPDEIIIRQDFIGSYGLYFYENREEKNFCISNSFIKLVEYLKDKYPISLNESCTNALLTSNAYSFAINQTLINEIKILPREIILKIDTVNKTVNQVEIDYQEKSVAINSEEALTILDNWFFKWTGFVRNLKRNTNNISIDLSGGFDSRGIFSLILASNIDLNEVIVHTHVGGKGYTLEEDYEIATNISKKLGFTLNNYKIWQDNKSYFQDIDTSLKLSFYLKLGCHNQLHYKTYRNNEPYYFFGGNGGEIVREYATGSWTEYFENSKRCSEDFYNSTKEVLENNKRFIKDFDNYEQGTFREAGSRYHFGRAAVEDYFVNVFSLSPYLDPDINKIQEGDDYCPDRKLLMALIYTRYSPVLLEFGFTDNRKIDEKTLKYAELINNKYPLKVPNYDLIKRQKHDGNIVSDQNEEKFNISDINKLVKDLFYSNYFKRKFEVYYSPEIYRLFKYIIENSNYYPTEKIYTMISALKCIDDVKYNNYEETSADIIKWMRNISKQETYEEAFDKDLFDLLLNYNTARIDVINYGENNSIELVEISDERSNIYNTSWIDIKKGNGVSIENCYNKLKFTVKCIGDGNLTISLRGKNFLDKNNNRFPMYIDYEEFSINNETIFNQNKLTWHDESYSYTKEVKDNEIIEVSVKWKPVSNESNYIKTTSGKNEPKPVPNTQNSLTSRINDLEKKINNLNQNVSDIEKINNSIDTYYEELKMLFLYYDLKPRGVLKDTHLLDQELLNWIVNLCEKHSLNYWLDYGTLLGAVRHDGFIPWDDDIDLGMMRKDFDKLTEILNDEIEKNNLSDFIRVDLDYITENNVLVPFLQIFVTPDYKSFYAGVDIFPYDFLGNKDDCKEEDYLNEKVSFIQNMLENNNRKDCISKYYEKFNLNYEKDNYIISGIDGVRGGYVDYKFDILEYNQLFPLSKINFNNKEYNCPNNKDIWLKSIYGDYLVFPRNIHNHSHRVDYLLKNENSRKNFKEYMNKLQEINRQYDS